MTDASLRAQLVSVEADLVVARGCVEQSVRALRDEVARDVDWREWVRRKPGPLLAAGFVLGFLIGRRA